ncbi:4'-phosphopantetheinyl transferase psf-1 [Novipirellula galeiformis]|uniref:4'-phosphopantetheinyl transferase psf-1 n=1 Tax=Novipirellula galeiformis TaxID=2528004 RepID=A0A5C6C1M3_9BACT|nr:4'-phosphopantetheinyl transferase superfamily protein [Novipirellula galeiformis]TWU17406.1 4'-phosphopantetheinyl transferase psf-1 [Novipirellula galeiformis]
MPTSCDATLQSSNDTPVRVWHATSSSEVPGPVEAFCHQWLDESECERAERFRVMTSRNQHIVGRGMARHLLGGSEVPARSIEFHALQHGKPAVKSPPEIAQPFNIAHTDGLVLCGIGHTKHQLLGVDVERLERRTDPELATRYFSAPEIEYVHSFADARKRKSAFLRVWTLKEAFIKAIGTGLHTPLSDFAFENIDDDTPTIRMLDPRLESDQQWSFFSFYPRQTFIAAIAVATHPDDPRVSMQLSDFDEVVAQHA